MILGFAKIHSIKHKTHSRLSPKCSLVARGCPQNDAPSHVGSEGSLGALADPKDSSGEDRRGGQELNGDPMDPLGPLGTSRGHTGVPIADRGSNLLQKVQVQAECSRTFFKRLSHRERPFIVKCVRCNLPPAGGKLHRLSHSSMPEFFRFTE